MRAEKHVVVLVHGMGKHRPGEFRRQFTRALNSAMQRYRGFETRRIENLAIVEEINYDRFFDEARARMAQTSAPIYERLAGIAALTGPEPGLVLTLANIERKLGHDRFLYTHFLDVILYSSLLGARVRIEVARQLAGIIADYPTRRIHIVAHSLGTAVVHDTLDLLYRENADLSHDIPGLSVVTHRLASIWMIANVSRLMTDFSGLTDPYRSVVRPGPGGCTNHLIDVRHALDVFTWYRPFAPDNDGSWIPRTYFERAYAAIETSVVNQPNPHDFAGYVADPELAVPLLARLVRLAPAKQELVRVADAYRRSAIPGAFGELREAFGRIRPRVRATLLDLAMAAREFREIVDQFRVQLDAMAS